MSKGFSINLSPIHDADFTSKTSSSCQQKLYNAIIESGLVYGIDETYKGLDIDESGTIQDVYDKLLCRDIKLQFLQVLSHCCIYPARATNVKSSSVGANCFQPPATPTMTDKDRTLGEGISRKFRLDDLGLSWETVDSLQFLAYPEGPQLYASEVEPACVPMILTDITGTRTYAVGLKFARPFFIQKPEDGAQGRYNLICCNNSTNICPPNSKLIYLPTCVILISKYPYFKFMRESLSGLYRLISNEDTDSDMWSVLKDFIEKIFLVPCLPEGMLSLEVTLPGFSSPTFIMPPRCELHLDVRLNYPFLCLSVDNVLKVVAALLCEQTIIFTSANYSLPALIIQCFLSYIGPFEWRHSIVPIVPNDQIDMLGAPGINIMGCHVNFQDDPEFLNIEDAVIVKLDENIVQSKLTSLSSFPDLPEADAATFKMRYQQLSEGNFDIDSLERLVSSSAVEREKARNNYDHYKDTMLTTLFLELMVGVFCHISEGLGESRAAFEERLSGLPEKDQFFYRCATQTDMFSVFMMTRRMKTRDSFSVFADQVKKRTRLPNASLADNSIVMSVNPFSWRRISSSILGVAANSSFVNRQSILSTQQSIDDRFIPSKLPFTKLNFFKELQCLEMPAFPSENFNRGKYLEEILKGIEVMMNDKTIQANCLYLYAYYKIAQGSVMKGLQVFSDDLQRLNLVLVPSAEHLQELMSLLNNEEKTSLQQNSFFKQLLPQRESESSRRSNTQYGLSSLFKTRKKPLVHSDFSKEMKQENVTKDSESASNLFSVLQSIGQSATVSPELFQTFLESWKQSTIDIETGVAACGFALIRDKPHGVQERVLAINTNFRSHLSAHCIVVLTTHRIVLLSNAGLKETTFANLSELSTTSFCKCEIALHYIGPKSPVIKLDPTEILPKEPIKRTSRPLRKVDPYIGFPDSIIRDLWYRMFKEVVFGWHMVFTRKDPTVMNQVECHIKILQALNSTGWMDNIDNSLKFKLIQKILSVQSKPVQPDMRVTEALQYRINPNTYHIEKATIESTLFVPSQISGGLGKLWLGLGNGCLRVYDMETHCFESDLKIIDSRRGKTVRVSCMLLVDFHVWVGSLNKTIHILDVETLCHVSQLSYLEDEPRDLCLDKNEPNIVWALLLNGVVLGFDPETREKVAKIQVPDMIQHSFCTCFTIWRDFLWIGNNRGSIAIVNTVNRTNVNELTLARDSKQVEIKFLAVSSEDQIWCSVHSFPRSEDSTYISVYDPRTLKVVYTYSKLDSNHRVSFILPVKNTIWCGTKSGKIYVFSAKPEQNSNGPKILDAHDDKVRSMTYAHDNLVVSGSGSNDGYANVWLLMNWFNE